MTRAHNQQGEALADVLHTAPRPAPPSALDPVELSSAILRERAGGKDQAEWDAFAHAPQAERWWRSLPRRLAAR